ncbi:NADH dehydrogenase subunit M [Litorimonas taeanensis]|uniref:NADH dehydrogenase subunit M n=1 Tax=Litorimonas taeanensis TaxID=568099 RepID=A0A420WKZ9_9PROT|nr:NADH-quinone oxidoreductase subunit M [Litorimonas taeanensis]RKQ71649.1 NADH dehydrogenase subunit M [Litorimonas taeanensis]
MFNDVPVLSFLTFTPLVVGVLLLFWSRIAKPEAQEQLEKNSVMVALFVSSVVFFISLLLVIDFDPTNAGFQFEEDSPWLGGGIEYRLGVDGISILFVLLTTFLTPLCIFASQTSIKERLLEYMAAFLILESLVIGVFCALDMVLFYLFFEAVLIPMFIIIGVWGGKNRVYASYKFFLYTLLGSVLMLAAIIYLYNLSGQQFGEPTTDMRVLINELKVPLGAQTWLWLAFFASFAVKMPMWPVHTWLPDAHVQAPTAGSVILAGILLKLGGYGFLRFSLTLFPNASLELAPIIYWMSVIAIIYTSLVAYRQTDMKKLIAYSSVAHMGFVTLGIFAFNLQGIQGGIFQMLSHGVISGALFFLVGVIYDRMHTREIAFYGGLVSKMPVYAAFFLLFTMANVGLPGTSGFVGEILTMVGAYQVNPWLAFGAAFGMILSAVYALYLYREVVFGETVNEKLEGIADLTRREWAILTPLAIMTLVLGVYPSLITDITAASVENLITNFNAATTVVEVN